MHTGITTIDSILDGFRLDQLVTVSGSTGSGKTTFSMELTIRMKEYAPVWVPFEEGADELVRKFLERGETPPLFYTPKHITGKKTDWIEQRIIEGKVKFNSKIFFIDHLHFIVPFTGERHDLSVGKTMRELKELAKKWNVCIFIICHLKKVGVDKLPTLDSLRDSSFIGQESDTVIMIWRSPYKGQENYTKVDIQKNRRTGKLGTAEMYFDGASLHL
jgi:replicative DNA helicase